MSYTETGINNSFNRGRRNTNETTRAILESFYGTAVPTSSDFTDESGNSFNPPNGTLHYNSNAKALYVVSSHAQRGAPQGQNLTRVGIGSRSFDTVSDMVSAAATIEPNELVTVISSGGNANLYLRSSNVNSLAGFRNVSEFVPGPKSIDETQIADSAVINRSIGQGAVDTDEIAEDAVTGAKVADDTLETGNYKGRSVTGPIIALDAVDTEHLADNAAGSAQVGVLDTVNYGARTVTNPIIGLGAVEYENLGDDVVRPDKVQDNAINTDGLNVGGSGSVGQILGSDADKSMSWVNRVERGTLRSLNGQSSVEWTSIPSWVKRIEISMFKVPNGGRDVGLVIGDSGGYEETSYEGIVRVGNQSTYWTPTDQFPITTNQSGSYSGNILLLNTGGNMWTMSVSLWYSSTTYGAGVKELSATLDRLKLQIASGNFSGGQANILYS